jgi:hypothetical protein
VLLSSIILAFVFIAIAIFMAYGIRASAGNKYDKAEAEMAAHSSKAIKEKPLVGVVKGIILSSPSSSAVVDETIVHAGDVIHEITVVGISDNKVEPVKVAKLPGK